ncbi:hypothetical protein D9619_004378 [Psilocybe cf. subviscida]|uniref:Uncharacterized protein n=1 Tax=Psilocybe cf. subviscida TaxID=2480587 RepID=A0A8H5BNW6_9AGAR|nr:hypothetical protein D9619_004378 [Psilocybe cf. subviscida]
MPSFFWKSKDCSKKNAAHSGLSDDSTITSRTGSVETNRASAPSVGQVVQITKGQEKEESDILTTNSSSTALVVTKTTCPSTTPAGQASQDREKAKANERKSEIIDAALSGTATLLKVLKEVAEFAPVPGLQKATELALGFVETVQEVKDIDRQFISLGDHATRLVASIWRSYKDSTQKEDWLSEHLREIISELVTTLTEITRYVQKKKQKRGFDAFIKFLSGNADLGNLRDFEKRIDWAFREFELTSRFAESDMLKQIHKQLKPAHQLSNMGLKVSSPAENSLHEPRESPGVSPALENKLLAPCSTTAVPQRSSSNPDKNEINNTGDNHEHKHENDTSIRSDAVHAPCNRHTRQYSHSSDSEHRSYRGNDRSPASRAENASLHNRQGVTPNRVRSQRSQNKQNYEEGQEEDEEVEKDRLQQEEPYDQYYAYSSEPYHWSYPAVYPGYHHPFPPPQSDYYTPQASPPPRYGPAALSAFMPGMTYMSGGTVTMKNVGNNNRVEIITKTKTRRPKHRVQ